jgi:23S rRNA G2445 N2-methylase RlmL
MSEDQTTLHDTYKRFGAMLRRRTDLQRVFVLSGSKEFQKASEQKWEVKAKFDNRGISVEFLQLQRSS